MQEQRASANGEGLLDYIQDCQDLATQLSGLIESAAVIDNEGVYPNGVTTLLKVSGDMTNHLVARLDSVNLPKVQS